jgi:hypothetical protein
MRAFIPLALGLSLLLPACVSMKGKQEFPQAADDLRRERGGKLTGDGIALFDPNKPADGGSGGGGGIGVNSFLWRASLDTLGFMPLASADPFGGVIITDWYENPEAPGERFKANVLIKDKSLRADGVQVRLFKQRKSASGQWQDVASDATLNRKMEDAILTRARELRVKQLESK